MAKRAAKSSGKSKLIFTGGSVSHRRVVCQADAITRARSCKVPSKTFSSRNSRLTWRTQVASIRVEEKIMRNQLLVALLLIACSRDSAKDKEIVELRAKLAQQEKPEPKSLGAVEPRQPVSSEKDEAQKEIGEAELETKLRVNGPFTRDIKGQLDRAGGVLWHLSKAKPDKYDYPPWNAKYLGWMGIEDIFAPDSDQLIAFWRFAKDAGHVNYQQLLKGTEPYIGTPVFQKFRILEIHEEGKPVITYARVTGDFYGRTTLAVFGRFKTDFVAGNLIDVVGFHAGSFEYKSQAGWDISLPAIAAVAMVKYGSLARCYADYQKTITKPGMSPPIAIDKMVEIIEAVK